MATRNDPDNYEWARPRREADRNPHRLHDYDQPGPPFKETLVELITTLLGIVGVICLIIALVKVFNV